MMVLSPIPTKPVIPGFHPDPSVCRCGDDFYLVNSSFEYVPGVPIWHSRDLRHWRQIGHVLDGDAGIPVQGMRPSGGVYAPTLRHHNGTFWMITTNVSDGPGHLLVHATAPEGPWSTPVAIQAAAGIDPDLAWDEAGTCWLSWSGSDRDGRHGIMQAVLNPRTGALLSEPRLVWQGTGGTFPEGPHLYRVGAYWYLMIAEGGTERGHCVTVARAPRPDGPFDESPHNPLLTARSSASPTQNVGHADLIERPDGQWAAVFLGVRPHGATPGFHTLGRETFACEIEWVEGWPVAGAPIEGDDADRVEELAGQQLPASWVRAGAPLETSRTENGWRWDATTAADFIGRRQEHRYAWVTAQITPGTNAPALEIRVDPHHRYGVRSDGAHVSAYAVIGGREIVLGETAAAPSTLSMRVRPPAVLGVPGEGPDEISLGWLTDGAHTEIATFDGRYLATEVTAGFTGRMVGVSAGPGPTTIRAFRYAGSDDPDSATLHG